MGHSISVILPFRNAAATLPEAVEGLLTSDDPSIEVLALDDGSTDSGPEWVRDRARRDPRLRLWATGGRGLVPTLRRGLELARGALVARMDADDIASPERLSKQRDWLTARPSLGALGSRVETFGSVGEGLARYVRWQNSLLSPQDHRRQLFVEAPLCHPSVMLRRSALDAVGGYRDVDGPEDYDLWLRLDEAGWELAKHPEVLLRWRHSGGRLTFEDSRYALSRFRAVKAPFLAERVRRAGRTAVVWGAGPTGRRLTRALEPHGFEARAFIDIDPRKIGRTARGAPIHGPEALDATRDVVVAAVGARGARELIRPELDGLGFVEGETYWFAA